MNKFISSLVLSGILAISANVSYAKTLDSGFSTQLFDYKIPKALQVACQNYIQKLPKDERPENENCATFEIQLAKFSNPEYQWIADILNDDFVGKNGQTVTKEFDEMIQDYVSYLPDEPYLIKLEEKRDILEISSSPLLAQFTLDTYSYYGGAHGLPGIGHMVFDLKQKKLLTLNDILTSPQQAKVLEKLLLQRFKQILKDRAAADGEVFSEKDWLDRLEWWEFSLNDNFYFTPKGLVFTYNVYEIGAYAEGAFVLTLDKKALKGIIKDEYLSQRFDYFNDHEWSEHND